MISRQLVFCVSAGIIAAAPSALADLSCDVSTVTANVPALCTSFTVPDDAGMSTSFTCRGYDFTLTADPYRSSKVSWSVGPHDGLVLRQTFNHLPANSKVVDDNGNGGILSCKRL